LRVAIFHTQQIKFTEEDGTKYYYFTKTEYDDISAPSLKQSKRFIRPKYFNYFYIIRQIEYYDDDECNELFHNAEEIFINKYTRDRLLVTHHPILEFLKINYNSLYHNVLSDYYSEQSEFSAKDLEEYSYFYDFIINNKDLIKSIIKMN